MQPAGALTYSLAVRRRIRGTLARAAGWAALASLSSLALALLVGVGGFRALDAGAHVAVVRVTHSSRPALALIEAMHRVEHAQAAEAAATDPLVSIAPAAVHARAAQARFAAEPTSAPTTATLAIQSRPQALSIATPDLAPGDRVEVPVTFYYCQDGSGGYPRGDGGGFCGLMRDGTRVYPGAAACAYRYLGQVFRIVGDPTGRIYRCADTGSAIHGLHRDIWFNNSDDGWVWQLAVGRSATIEILP